MYRRNGFCCLFPRKGWAPASSINVNTCRVNNTSIGYCGVHALHLGEFYNHHRGCLFGVLHIPDKSSAVCFSEARSCFAVSTRCVLRSILFLNWRSMRGKKESITWNLTHQCNPHSHDHSRWREQWPLSRVEPCNNLLFPPTLFCSHAVI